MDQLLAMELFKIRKRMMTWILFAVLGAFMILYVVLSYLSVTSLHSGLPDNAYNALVKALQFPIAATLVLSVIQGVGVILIVILSASIIGNEYGWGTVTQIIGRTGRRPDYVRSKIFAIIVVTLLLVLFGLALGWLVTMFTTYKLTGHLSFSFFDLSFAGKLLKMFLWTAFTIVVYGLMAVLFATLARSVVAGIGATLGYYLIIENILIGVLNSSRGWTHRIPDYIIGHNASSLLQTGIEGPFGGQNAPPSGIHATIVLLAYSAVFIALILRLFRRQDLTA